jgi:hypothetical protein
VKKSTAFLTTVIGALALSVFAMAAEQNPVTLLPGMRPADRIGTPPSVVSALPQPVISNLFNAPNPVDTRKSGLAGQTEIAYTLAGDFKVTITLYDLLGFKVRSWAFHPGETGGRMGVNTVLWNGTNEAGQKVSKGGYLAMVEVETPVTIATALRKIAVIH